MISTCPYADAIVREVEPFYKTFGIRRRLCIVCKPHEFVTQGEVFLGLTFTIGDCPSNE